MSQRLLILIALGAALAGAAIYALVLVPPKAAPAAAPIASPSEEAPSKPPPPPPAPLPPTLAAQRAAQDTGPVDVIQELHITPAERAAIQPALEGAQLRAREMMARTDRLRPGSGDGDLRREDMRKIEADTFEELTRTLGQERARRFMELTRGGRLGLTLRPPTGQH
jgi:hypothetical protein